MKHAEKMESNYGESTVLAATLVLIVYPMTIAPIGTLSNGGTIGLLTLLCALALSWRAPFFNRTHLRTRLLVQLPLAAITSFLVIADAYKQFVAGQLPWL